jgi:hypothetical protein
MGGTAKLLELRFEFSNIIKLPWHAGGVIKSREKKLVHPRGHFVPEETDTERA